LAAPEPWLGPQFYFDSRKAGTNGSFSTFSQTRSI
jgi:hypothetical protein